MAVIFQKQVYRGVSEFKGAKTNNSMKFFKGALGKTSKSRSKKHTHDLDLCEMCDEIVRTAQQIHKDVKKMKKTEKE